MRGLKQIAASPMMIFVATGATRTAAAVYILICRVPPQTLFIANEPSNIGKALVSGLGFSSPYANTPATLTAQQPPIYPVILAGIFKVFGTCTTASVWAIIALHVFAGAITGVLLFRLGKIYFGESVGLIAAWLWVLPWTYEIRAFNLAVSSHALAALAFTGFLLLLARVLVVDRGWFSLGLFAGLIVLLQPSFLIVFAAYALLAIVKAPPRRMVVALMGGFLVLAPWTIRNFVEFGRVIPIRDNLGLELWLGNHEGMRGTVDYSRDFPGNDPANYIRQGELGFMDSKFHQATEFIISAPIAFGSRCLQRFIEFWYVPHPFAWILMPVVGWLGAGMIRRDHQCGWPFVIPLVAFPLVYYVTHNFAYYRHPIDPVIILLAAYAIARLTGIAQLS